MKRPTPDVVVQSTAARLPLRWHTDPHSGARALFPALTPAQVRHLFNLAERDRRHYPEHTRTLIHYRGRRFTVDGSVLGLRLWFGKTLVSRRFGFGL